MNEISKAILKAKKLYRLTESSNDNESSLARSQLEKLKKKFKLTDAMIFPVYTKVILSLKKEDKLNVLDEYLTFNIGQLFSNKVQAENKKDKYEISYKGNDITIENSIKTISFINRYIDRHLESKDIEDKYSFKCGVGISICQFLKANIKVDDLVLDEKTEADNSKNFSDIPKEEIEPLLKDEPNGEIVLKGQKSVNDSFMFAIEEFIKGLL